MISKEEIQNLAGLARLELTEEETAGLQKDISNILDYVGQLSSTPEKAADKPVPASLQGMRGWSAGTDLSAVVHNVMREDTPRSEDDLLAGKEKALIAAFPKGENGYNVVRKIIQKDE
jgi:Asp-tRNA(Asn)/Glu-tRNA(Gln) amidotransferase C subunit